MEKTLWTWTLLAVFSLLVVKGMSDGLDLADALGDDDDDEPTTKPPKADPGAGGAGGAAVKPTLKPVKPTVKEPAKPKPKQTGLDDFDLADALNPDNDIKGKGKDSGKGDKEVGGGSRDDGTPNSRGSQFSDDDLLDVGNDNSYKPDKGKGGKGGSSSNVGDLDPADDNNYDTMAETGTIAGIVSAVAMALVGAVSSYISYQKKKLCFSIQQSLNADMVKADAPDAVVAQEPQVQQTLLQPPNAEPPTEENAV
ncbi:CD99 antigen-like protein 2 isoform 3 precursor [Danio rerio]|uniref:CD99 antigen-like protein 2 n=1 Tax=Danio rerio TaxID=7955 RepID=C99L2_DANRE|nr:CD99 antigen-like protein 2 isoform 3 precursor [Danio rerio]Q6DBW9.1 RecName: Full=CD99 antigen-like protein 2; AltName: CD_antigen=CD99; Flags: Precursor [Danio rerio]AAH78330.1 Cd99l2 protein [Danio rerio]|eukprot:NP_001315453.1 CD99 antigen-like protein 2 isoform 3 precursor [Danio rerio]